MSEMRGLRILLVEDNPDDVFVIRRAFRRGEVDVEISVAWDGEEALNLLYGVGGGNELSRPDLILLDINLPKINGLEVLAKIKEEESLRRIPVIVLTISEREEDMVKAYDTGAASYMTKPVDTADFTRLLTTIYDYWHIARVESG